MRTSRTIYWFIAPGLLFYLVFFVYPTLSGLYYSLTDWDGLSPTYDIVGLSNYMNLIADDLVFAKSIKNNVKFMLFIVLFQTLFSLIFALLLVKNTKVNVFFRAVYFFPMILSSVAVAFTWSFMYDPSLGLINRTLEQMGLSFLALNWIGDADIAIYSIALVQVWAHAGQMMVIFIAGLQSIPEELYEVARIEGAGRWHTFRKVTWPLVAPAATIVVAYTTLQSFKSFDLIYAMTEGGPNHSTEIITTFIYQTAFSGFEFGYATAGSFILMMIIALLTVVQFKLLRSDRVRY